MAAAKHGDTVKIAYTGKLEDGTVFGSVSEEKPFEFRIGDLERLDSFENAISGMKKDEEKIVKIPSRKAFGPYRKDFVIKVERVSFSRDIKLEKGKKYQIPWKKNGKKEARITALTSEYVVFDANHPLAGEDLTFYIKLVDIC